MCPWLPLVEIFGDDSTTGGKERERGLRDCEAVVPRCYGLIMVGGRISGGMRRELEAATRNNVIVADLTRLGPYPPEGIPDGLPWPIEQVG